MSYREPDPPLYETNPPADPLRRVKPARVPRERRGKTAIEGQKAQNFEPLDLGRLAVNVPERRPEVEE
jgi:hypothetical protein